MKKPIFQYDEHPNSGSMKKRPLPSRLLKKPSSCNEAAQFSFSAGVPCRKHECLQTRSGPRFPQWKGMYCGTVPGPGKDSGSESVIRKRIRARFGETHEDMPQEKHFRGVKPERHVSDINGLFFFIIPSPMTSRYYRRIKLQVYENDKK